MVIEKIHLEEISGISYVVLVVLEEVLMVH